ncbi:HAD family hydrolase [Streptomyces zagrosensis]|uniref:phosphoserine phosphatase n=1 Tax=Streptomyces zagrosensis TaxID=1042984 RepID=A0A7W9Q953_9ACTN|nr:haloacid dehalogenase-like hydrolase [Streptomyces zagrosensis]MBB5935443.1 phosphoserine phosphatase [Streptomyces zagrosensis]
MRETGDGWEVVSDPSEWDGVVFVDIDGTLVPAPGSAVHVARYLGTEEEMAKAEAAYAAGLLTNPEIAAVDALAWAGHTETEIDNWLTQLPLVEGIAETVQWCRGHRLLPVLATLAWQPIGKHITKRFGFAAYCGPELERADGAFTGRVRIAFDEFGKRDFALRYAEDLGFALSRCAAIGDSRSDLPLFDEVGLSIAFNPDQQARDRASTVVDSGDLRSVTPLLANWCQRTS